MEQGAALELNGDVLTVIPRNDIYVRYLTDNRNVIADLASELYGRRIKAEVTAHGAGTVAASAATMPAPSATALSGGNAARVDSRGVAAESDAPPVESAAAIAAADSTAPGDIAPPPDTSGVGAPARSAGAPTPDTRQAIYSDPVVQRIFNELEARLVDVRAPAQPRTDTNPTTQTKR
jgi:hypothetical protein